MPFSDNAVVADGTVRDSALVLAASVVAAARRVEALVQALAAAHAPEV